MVRRKSKGSILCIQAFEFVSLLASIMQMPVIAYMRRSAYINQVLFKLNLYNRRYRLYSFFLHFYLHITYQILNLLKLKREIDGQYFWIVDLHFVKSAYTSSETIIIKLKLCLKNNNKVLTWITTITQTGVTPTFPWSGTNIICIKVCKKVAFTFQVIKRISVPQLPRLGLSLVCITSGNC